MKYDDPLGGMRRFGSTDRDICLHGLHVEPEQVRACLVSRDSCGGEQFFCSARRFPQEYPEGIPRTSNAAERKKGRHPRGFIDTSGLTQLETRIVARDFFVRQGAGAQAWQRHVKRSATPPGGKRFATIPFSNCVRPLGHGGAAVFIPPRRAVAGRGGLDGKSRSFIAPVSTYTRHSCPGAPGRSRQGLHSRVFARRPADRRIRRA